MKKGAVVLRIGVSRLILELKALGISQWIVTSSSQKSLEPLVSAFFPNYQSLFDGFITSDSVGNLKPSPDSYNRALDLSKSHIKNCIAKEINLHFKGKTYCFAI